MKAKWGAILIISVGVVGCVMSPAATDNSPVQPTAQTIATRATAEATPLQAAVTGSPSPAPISTSTPTITVTPSLTPTPPSWGYVAPGIERTVLLSPAPESGANIAITAVRIDPALVQFQVHYDADAPRSISDWLAVTEAAIVFNGGFFSGDNRPVGRIVVDGDLYGAPIRLDTRVGTSGLFAVVDDKADIYALGTSDYTPRGMRFETAVEGYPMLLLPGQQVIYPAHSGRRARRTVIGMDDEGNVIVLLVDSVAFTLYELARWLATSNLYLSSALNLDGGRSSGMAINGLDQLTVIPAYVPLPIVVAVYPR